MMAYIGRVRRYLGLEGELGFHQFTLDSIQKMLYINPEEEQRIDKDFFREWGVDTIFFERIFRTYYMYIKFPRTLEFFQASAVYEISSAL